jgi:predicted unusual protein kinase regulating ubiquinone biosynthesis (AarF/ABC1/UbiB family)
LQDRVPSFSWPVVESLLEEEYGRPVAEVFAYFDKVPLAAASLGQVHRAGLRVPGSSVPEDVVIKIQRPALRQLFDLDLDALKQVAEFLQKSKKWGGNGRDWVGIYTECRSVLYDEIDYRLEAQNCELMRANFANDPKVIVPRAISAYTTERVLCMEYIPGMRINDKVALLRAGIDLKDLATRNGQVLLKQILDHSFFNSGMFADFLCLSPFSLHCGVLMVTFSRPLSLHNQTLMLETWL